MRYKVQHKPAVTSPILNMIWGFIIATVCLAMAGLVGR
jgi:hypothetical protein